MALLICSYVSIKRELQVTYLALAQLMRFRVGREAYTEKDREIGCFITLAFAGISAILRCNTCAVVKQSERIYDVSCTSHTTTKEIALDVF